MHHALSYYDRNAQRLWYSLSLNVLPYFASTPPPVLAGEEKQVVHCVCVCNNINVFVAKAFSNMNVV